MVIMKHIITTTTDEAAFSGGCQVLPLLKTLQGD